MYVFNSNKKSHFNDYGLWHEHIWLWIETSNLFSIFFYFMHILITIGENLNQLIFFTSKSSAHYRIHSYVTPLTKTYHWFACVMSKHYFSTLLPFKSNVPTSINKHKGVMKREIYKKHFPYIFLFYYTYITLFRKLYSEYVSFLFPNG